MVAIFNTDNTDNLHKSAYLQLFQIIYSCMIIQH